MLQVLVVLFVHVLPVVPFFNPRTPLCPAVASVQPRQLTAASVAPLINTLVQTLFRSLPVTDHRVRFTADNPERNESHSGPSMPVRKEFPVLLPG